MKHVGTAALGRRIAEAIRRSGMSREAVARALQAKGLKVSAGHLRRWIKGEHEPRASLLMNLADVTGQDPEWLFGTKRGTGAPSADSAAQPDDQVERLGRWMLDLDEDVRTLVYSVGEVLSRPNGWRDLARIAGEAVARTTPGTDAGVGTSHKGGARANRPPKNGGADD